MMVLRKRQFHDSQQGDSLLRADVIGQYFKAQSRLLTWKELWRTQVPLVPVADHDQSRE